MNRQKILIVDDSEMNREMLKAILGEGYKYAEAVDGAQALRMLQQDMNIDLVLLDINMPKIDGFAVLEHMNQFRWIDEIPVIMISAADDRESIKRCYSLGVADYIRRPFDSYIVQRRVQNTLRLYANQKRLMGMVSDQIYRNQRDSNVMIGILSHIVEFRNSESAQHVLQVQTVTGMLLRRLVEKTDVYHLTEEKIRLIVTASALHDIGKISIPENILNKPGRLTPEEFDVIRTHPAIGASMLEGLTPYRKEPLLKTAIEICRWHHERWDGRGYPDGLLGEQIPISAQVVALADVYDALTSDRCYKKAYSHDTAVSMILNGECGAFNPMLLDCLQEISASLRHALPLLAVEQSMKKDAQRLSSELLRNSNMPRSDRAQRELDSLREKLIFFASCCGGVQFEYDTISRSVLVVDWSRPGRQSRTIMDVNDPDNMRPLRPADVARLRSALKATTPENNELSISVLLPVAGEQHWHSIRLHTLWSPLSPGSYVGVIGCMTDMQKEQDRRERLALPARPHARRGYAAVPRPADGRLCAPLFRDLPHPPRGHGGRSAHRREQLQAHQRYLRPRRRRRGAARHRGRDTLVHPQDRHPHPLRRGRVPAPVPAHDRGDLPREEKADPAGRARHPNVRVRGHPALGQRRRRLRRASDHRGHPQGGLPDVSGQGGAAALIKSENPCRGDRKPVPAGVFCALFARF